MGKRKSNKKVKQMIESIIKTEVEDYGFYSLVEPNNFRKKVKGSYRLRSYGKPISLSYAAHISNWLKRTNTPYCLQGF